MFCPHTIVFDTRWLLIIRHEETDYVSRRRVPWRQRINPLRYELVFRPGTSRHWSINAEGAAARALSDFLYRLRTGDPECTCEACGRPVFKGEPWFGGETPLCGTCAPTYAELLSPSELSGFVTPGEDGGWRPMTADEAREIYDAHIAAGGKPTDSMARVQ